MARSRGGGTGQGRGQGGGKRQATTPVGGVYKDQRRNIDSSVVDYQEEDEDENWTEVRHNKRQSPRRDEVQHQGDEMLRQNYPNPSNEQPSTSRQSFASIAAQGTSMQNRRNSAASAACMQPKKVLERKFRTPDPEGPMRDELVIEVQSVNGRPFKGSLIFTEAKEIFTTFLGLDIAQLHGIRFAFSTYPVVKYKLKQQINVDDLHYREYFTYERHYKVKGEDRADTLNCKIRGIRAPTDEQQPTDSDPSVRWVKVEWVDYGIEETQILDWLNFFGEQAGELTEDIHPNSDSDADPIGAGSYSIKMRLNKDIPQLLPMWGKRVRVYHKGIQKLCSNCFGPHPRRVCRSEKVAWTRYVLDFMEKNRDIPSDLYGRWWDVINKEFGEIIEEEQESNAPEGTVSESRPERETTERNDHERERERHQPERHPPRLSRQEEENLSDYLSLGMTISEARLAFQKEVESAELRQQIRDKKRAINRGSVEVINTTRYGPTTNSRGGRGGLSFN